MSGTLIICALLVGYLFLLVGISGSLHELILIFGAINQNRYLIPLGFIVNLFGMILLSLTNIHINICSAYFSNGWTSEVRALFVYTVLLNRLVSSSQRFAEHDCQLGIVLTVTL